MKLVKHVSRRRLTLSPLTEGRGLKLEEAAGELESQASPLTEGRGLKLVRKLSINLDSPVAPHRGAWIETTLPVGKSKYLLSPLTEGRGLKLMEP